MIEESGLEKYRRLFRKDIRDILRAEVTLTIETIVGDYDEERYDINEAVAELKLRLQVYIRTESKDIDKAAKLARLQTATEVGEVRTSTDLSQSHSTLRHSQSAKSSVPIKNRLFDQFFVELSMFFWSLSRAPGVWVMLLREEQLTSETRIIDLYQFIRPVYSRLVMEGQKTCHIFAEICRLVQPQLLRFLEKVSVKISDIYNQNKRLIVELIDQLNTETSTIKLINKYVIYKLLRELSQSCYEQVREKLNEGLFRNVQPELLDVFTNYTIEKHELITFSNQQLEEIEDKPIGGLEEQLETKLLKKLSNQGKKVRFREAQREDGQQGVLVEVERDEKDEATEESYLIKLSEDGNQLKVINVASVQKKWSFNASHAISGPQDLVADKKSVIDALKSAPTNAKKVTVESGLETMGGSLGSCLANIRNYDSVGSFVVDFSSKTVVSGSLNYLVERVPIMGYFLVAGGFTYSFYRVLKSNFKTTNKKIQDLGKMALDTGTSLGAGIIGGIVGQVVIPIPFVGMFVGSLVGGFLGNIGKDVLLKHLEGKRFEEIALYLDRSIQVRGYWEPTDALLDVLGVTRNSFERTIPEWLKRREDAQRIWITVLGFCLLSFRESQKDREKLKLQMEQHPPEPQATSLKDQHEDTHNYISLNLEMVVHYLEEEDIRLRWSLPEIQHFLQKMFSG